MRVAPTTLWLRLPLLQHLEDFLQRSGLSFPADQSKSPDVEVDHLVLAERHMNALRRQFRRLRCF
jgi:hypothetical protein